MRTAAAGSLRSSVSAETAAAAAATAAARNVASGERPSSWAPSVGAIARPAHQESPIDAMYRPRSPGGARSAASGISAVVWKHSPAPAATDYPGQQATQQFTLVIDG